MQTDDGLPCPRGSAHARRAVPGPPDQPYLLRVQKRHPRFDGLREGRLEHRRLDLGDVEKAELCIKDPRLDNMWGRERGLTWRCGIVCREVCSDAPCDLFDLLPCQPLTAS